MAKELDGLREALVEDVAKGEATQKSFEQSAGAVPVQQPMQTMLRQKRRLVAEAQIKENSDAIEKTVQNFLTESGLALDVEKEQFSSALRKKLHTVQQSLLREASRAHLRAQKLGLSQQQQMQLAQSIGNMVGTGAMFAVSGIGGKSDLEQGGRRPGIISDTYQAPSSGMSPENLGPVPE